MAKGVEDKNRVRQEDFLSLADGGFSVVAGHIVEFHPIPERREHYYQVDFQL